MSVYFLTGTLGAGKTLAAVYRISETLNKGLKVATNLDLNLEHLLNEKSKTSYTRLPDQPTILDLESIGKGSDKVDEKTYGLLVLDELGTWLNSRNWNDKSRQPVLDWFLHARKLGWHIIFIVQNIDLIDKQARDALCEYLIICRRLDKLPILQIFLPKYHLATVYYGNSDRGFKVDRWWYKGKKYYDAYDTRQVFSPLYEKGSFTQLPNWHLKARYDTSTKKKFPNLHGYYRQALAFGTGIAVASAISSYATVQPQNDVKESVTEKPVQPRPNMANQIDTESIAKLGNVTIIGSLDKILIFKTKQGNATTDDLVNMGFGVMYFNKCTAQIRKGTISLNVSCAISRPPAQTVVEKKAVSDLIL